MLFKQSDDELDVYMCLYLCDVGEQVLFDMLQNCWCVLFDCVFLKVLLQFDGDDVFNFFDIQCIVLLVLFVVYQEVIDVFELFQVMCQKVCYDVVGVNFYWIVWGMGVVVVLVFVVGFVVQCVFVKVIIGLINFVVDQFEKILKGDLIGIVVVLGENEMVYLLNVLKWMQDGFVEIVSQVCVSIEMIVGDVCMIVSGNVDLFVCIEQQVVLLQQVVVSVE